jgi:hypothetical protein
VHVGLLKQPINYNKWISKISRQQALRPYCPNIYTLIKGLVDIALLTANANQLRHVIQLENEAMRILNIVLISLSITLQVDL